MEIEKSDRKLLLYIQTQIEAGVSREEIIKRLSKVKWTESQINVGLNAYDRGERETFSFFSVSSIIIDRILDLLLLFIKIAIVLGIIFFIINYIEHAEDRRNHGGNDMSIKQTMGNVRSQAEVSYNKNGNVYSAVCGSDGFDQEAKVSMLLRAAEANSFSGGKVVCNSNAEAYAASVRLSGKNVLYWCVDSTGSALALTEPLNIGELKCSLPVVK